mmetsp:Transcript_110256/g.306601  ORF Transcript_110256/g.306601 Transcript_110256/m.306601 type:complete len:270 (+) Transcript_110256:27-836(+)
MMAARSLVSGLRRAAPGTVVGGRPPAASLALPSVVDAATGGGSALALRAPSGASAPSRWHALGSRRWINIHRAPGIPLKIYHPSVQEPEQKVILNGSLEGPAKYVPRHFRHQKFVESIRSGEYLGPDYPYRFLGKGHWEERRYNASYHPIPADRSAYAGVTFYPKLNIWVCEWYEQEKQRFRWFRAQYGFERAKQSAEGYRRSLMEAGRVDNRRTEREIRQQQLQAYASRSLFKKKFAKKDARRLGNSGTKMGPEWKVRKDYKARGLMP